MIRIVCPGKRRLPDREGPVTCSLDPGHDNALCRYTAPDGTHSWFIPENLEPLPVVMV